MPKAYDVIRKVQRGETLPPPILVARASSTCMTLRGEQAVGR